MDAFFALLTRTLQQVWGTFEHNWPFLLVSILIAAGLKLALDPQKVAAFFQRYRQAGVVGATLAAVTTPLCSCGTTAVILGMLASTLPWGPVVAFMVASPLTSPGELVVSAGLFGWPFALAFYFSSILLGLAGGWAANLMESRGWLKNQARFSAHPKTGQPARAVVRVTESCACSTAPAPVPQLALNACCAEAAPALTPGSGMTTRTASTACGAVETPCGCSTDEPARITLARFLQEAWQSGTRLVGMFVGFAFIGYFLNNLIPTEWVSLVFGGGQIYSVPLAATLGLPLYLNSEASLPLVRALIDNGMSQGAALAFLITGAGTSIGAVMGALTIARWRVLALVVGTLWVGAVVMGTLYNVWVVF